MSGRSRTYLYQFRKGKGGNAQSWFDWCWVSWTESWPEVESSSNIQDQVAAARPNLWARDLMVFGDSLPDGPCNMFRWDFGRTAEARTRRFFHCMVRFGERNI